MFQQQQMIKQKIQSMPSVFSSRVMFNQDINYLGFINVTQKIQGEIKKTLKSVVHITKENWRTGNITWLFMPKNSAAA